MSPETPPQSPQLRDLLEPGALSPGFPEEVRDTAWTDEIQASQAISLKRIADALSGQTVEISPGLYNQFIDMMCQGGQAFERGKRIA